MSEKQINYLLIIYLLLIICGSIYAANKKPYVPPEVIKLLKETTPTESDMRFGICFISVSGPNPSADLNEVRGYCNQFR